MFSNCWFIVLYFRLRKLMLLWKQWLITWQTFKVVQHINWAFNKVRSSLSCFIFILLWEIFSILLLLFLFGQFDINFADNFSSLVIFVFLLFLGMAMYANEVETRKINKNYLRWKINYNININFYIVVKILENCRSFLSIIFTPRSQDCSEGFDPIFHSLWLMARQASS